MKAISARVAMSSAIGLLCTVSSTALAQTTSTTTTADVAPGAPRASSDGDIVVTARRRQESITDVPIAVTAFSPEALASRGVERIDDLQRATPSLALRPTAGRRSNSQYEIRGITAVESLITGDPAVGVYVNEVYRARATGTNQSFYDIENVQVLYGPQGTLFGRNSSAGALLISTRRPTLDGIEGEISGTIGNFDRRELTGVLNVPFGDKVALRVAGQRNTRDGYGTNVTTGRNLANTDNWSVRASLLFKPNDAIENLLVGSIYSADELGSLVFLNGYRPCPPLGVTPRPAASCSATLGPQVAAAAAQRQTLGRYETALDSGVRDFRGGNGTFRLSPDSFERTRNYAVSNTTTIELSDDITLKNIVGYNRVTLVTANDLDGTPIKIIDTFLNTRATQFSEELQLQGETGGLTWVAGGMYFRERGQDVQNSIQVVTVDTRQNLIGINKSYAVFAQGTYKLLDNLSLTAGGRYSWDKRYAKYNNPRTITAAGNTCSLSPVVDTDRDCVFEDRADFKEPTYTVSVDYKPTPETLIYVAHRLGYRSGGLQARVALTAAGAEPAFKPEKVRDVEIGFKGDFELGQVRISPSIALYEAWYTDIQRQITVLTGLASPPTTTAQRNVGDANVKGIEAQLAVTPVQGFDITAFFGYVDGKYTTFRAVQNGVQTTLEDVPFTTSKYSGGVTVSVTPIDTPETGKVTVSTSYSYRSRFTTDQALPAREPESYSPEQDNINASILWDNIGGSTFSAQVWARNLTNEFQPLGFTSLAGSIGVTPGVLGEPRTYGLTLKYDFGR